MTCERSVPGGPASETEGVCVPGQGQCGEGVLRPPLAGAGLLWALKGWALPLSKNLIAGGAPSSWAWDGSPRGEPDGITLGT